MMDNDSVENQLAEREQAENEQIIAARYDRNCLRAVVDNQELRSAEMAAFLLGRLCNELRFSMQLGWIEMRHCVRNPDELFHEIAILSRELCENLESKQEQEASLAACREQWTSAFGSESRSDRLVDLFDQLNNTSNLHSEDTELFTLFNQQLSAIRQLTEAVLPKIAQVVTKNLLGYFEIGLIADQVLHPPFQRSALKLTRERKSQPSSWIASEQVETHCNRPTDVVAHSYWLAKEWWPKVKHTVVSSGVPLPATIEANFDISAPNATCQALGAISNAVPGLRPDNEGHNRWRVTLMPGKMTASRTGVAVHAKLSSLEFKLLSHFLISGDETTSLDSLKNNWQKFSTSKARSRDPVDKGISRLNGKIKPLGLIVEAPLPGGGWKLSESGPEKRGIARLTECLTEL